MENTTKKAVVKEVENKEWKNAELVEGSEEWEVEIENQGIALFERYKMWPKLDGQIFKAKTTKTTLGRNIEDIILRVKLGNWVKDIRPSPADKDFLTFKKIGTEYDVVVGKLISNKTGNPYWGMRVDLGNGNFLNYAFQLGSKVNDFRILMEMGWAKEVGVNA